MTIISKEHWNKMAVVWLKIQADASEVIEGKAKAGDRLVTVSFINEHGEFESGQCTLWPFSFESEHYEVVYFKPLDQIEISKEIL